MFGMILIFLVESIRSQILEILSGNGNAIPTGDLDGDLLNCQYNMPEGFLFFSEDEMLICDSDTNRIRQLTFSIGEVTSLIGDDVGTHQSGNFSYTRWNRPFNMISSNPSNLIYVSDQVSLRRIVNMTTVEDVLPDTLTFVPYGLAFDPTNSSIIYAASDRTIEMIHLPTSTHSTFVGDMDVEGCVDGIGENALFRNIRSMFYDEYDGYLYVSDVGNNNIRRIDLQTKEVTTYSGSDVGTGGYTEDASNARFSAPKGIISFKDRYFLVADTNNHVIRGIDRTTSESFLLVGDPGYFGMDEGDQQDETESHPPRIYAPNQMIYSESRKQLLFGTKSNYIYAVSFLPSMIDTIDIKDITESSCTLNWTEPHDGGFSIDEYEIFVQSSSTPSETYTFTSTNSQVFLSSLSQDTELSVQIRSRNYAGNSSWSTPLTFRTLIGCDGILSTNTSYVCSGGRGTCIAPETCSCSAGYLGPYCEFYSCFGYSSNDTNDVCSNGRGECVNIDTCSCFSTYTGDECQYTECFGIPSNDSTNVCNREGTCIDYNTCSCNQDFGGEQCEYPRCDGILSNETNSVCSGHGTCIDVDSCECSSNYFGQFCSITFCGGTLSNETNACSSHGNCSVFDICSCEENYYGEECEITSCDEIFTNQSNIVICSGHGDCIGFNLCDCQEGWIGDTCNEEEEDGLITEEFFLSVFASFGGLVILFLLLFLLLLGVCLCIFFAILTCLIIAAPFINDFKKKREFLLISPVKPEEEMEEEGIGEEEIEDEFEEEQHQKSLTYSSDEEGEEKGEEGEEEEGKESEEEEEEEGIETEEKILREKKVIDQKNPKIEPQIQNNEKEEEEEENGENEEEEDDYATTGSHQKFAEILSQTKPIEENRKTEDYFSSLSDWSIPLKNFIRPPKVHQSPRFRNIFAS